MGLNDLLLTYPIIWYVENQFFDILQVYTANKYVSDGCATFYRRDLFQAIKKYEVSKI